MGSISFIGKEDDRTKAGGFPPNSNPEEDSSVTGGNTLSVLRSAVGSSVRFAPAERVPTAPKKAPVENLSRGKNENSL